MALTTHPHLTLKLKEEYSYTCTSLLGLRGLYRENFTLFHDAGVIVLWRIVMHICKQHTAAVLRHAYAEDGSNLFFRNVAAHSYQNKELSPAS